VDRNRRQSYSQQQPVALTFHQREEEFRKANPGLIEGLEAKAGENEFLASLLRYFHYRTTLTPKQISAAWRQIGKSVAVGRIEAMFEVARRNGLKDPEFRTEHFRISAAPQDRANPGALYVVYDRIYAGKIVDGKFFAKREWQRNMLSRADDVVEKLREIAASPIEAARRYGRSTGICSCCNRKLTDPESVEAGIGPICAKKWGL
jgi:Family of unknown function (DUF6011)